MNLRQRIITLEFRDQPETEVEEPVVIEPEVVPPAFADIYPGTETVAGLASTYSTYATYTPVVPPARTNTFVSLEFEQGQSYTTRTGMRWFAPTRPLVECMQGYTYFIPTGKFVYGNRSEVESLIRLAGRLDTSISSVTILIVARTTGLRKIQSALGRRCPIYSEQEFYEALMSHYQDNERLNAVTRHRLRTCSSRALTSRGMLNEFIIRM